MCEFRQLAPLVAAAALVLCANASRRVETGIDELHGVIPDEVGELASYAAERQETTCVDTEDRGGTDEGCESNLPFCDSGDGTNDGDLAAGVVCRKCSGRGRLAKVDFNCSDQFPDCVDSNGDEVRWATLGDECVCLLDSAACAEEGLNFDANKCECTDSISLCLNTEDRGGTDEGCESNLPFCDSGDGTNDGDLAAGVVCRKCSGRGRLAKVDFNCSDQFPDCVDSNGDEVRWATLGDECVCLLDSAACDASIGEAFDSTKCECVQGPVICRGGSSVRVPSSINALSREPDINCDEMNPDCVDERGAPVPEGAVGVMCVCQLGNKDSNTCDGATPIFNEDSCSCFCDKDVSDCSFPTPDFDGTTCECVCNVDPNSCAGSKPDFDEGSCECICEGKTCFAPAPDFEKRSCSCVCEEKTCSEPTPDFDESTCECICDPHRVNLCGDVLGVFNEDLCRCECDDPPTLAECGGAEIASVDGCSCTCFTGQNCVESSLQILEQNNTCICGCVDDKGSTGIDFGCTADVPLCGAFEDGIAVSSGEGTIGTECQVCINDLAIYGTDLGCPDSTPLCDADTDGFGSQCFFCQDTMPEHQIDFGCSTTHTLCTREGSSSFGYFCAPDTA